MTAALPLRNAERDHPIATAATQIGNVMRVASTVFAGLLSATAAAAQTHPLPDANLARRVLIMALDDIQRAQCGPSGQQCAPATPEEKSTLPLTVLEAQMIVDRGLVSGVAEHCGLAWQRQNFVPMMAYWRDIQKKTERQMALIGVMHGIVQGQTAKAFASRGACTAQQRQEATSRLPFRAP